jgi:hypothetical protein
MSVVKYAKVRVSVELLRLMMQGRAPGYTGEPETETTAPEDLVVLGVEQPPHAIGAWFYALVESTTFKPVPVGAEIPEIEILITRRPPADS